MKKYLKKDYSNKMHDNICYRANCIDILSGNTYTADNTDLAIFIEKVRYRGDEYIKVKGKVFNKYNGIVYERKNLKLYYRLIGHWTALK